ncbi:KdgM Oligogalacturonate-specific porin protein [Salmonella bongori]|nr:KdgM Oligogalacturonate-specific porin protein [Salmonella bongori]
MDGGLPTFKNGFIMKSLNTIVILTSVISTSVFAGAYVENREAYNLASDQMEFMLRVGYNSDMGAGINADEYLYATAR